MTRVEIIKGMLGAWLGPGRIPDSPLDDRMAKVLDFVEPVIREKVMQTASDAFGNMIRHSVDGYVRLVSVQQMLLAIAEDARDDQAHRAPPPAPAVHHLHHGYAACVNETPALRCFPVEWPPGHKWSADWAEVTCAACLKHAPKA